MEPLVTSMSIGFKERGEERQARRGWRHLRRPQDWLESVPPCSFCHPFQRHILGILLPFGRWSWVLGNSVSGRKTRPSTRHVLLAALVLVPTSSRCRYLSPCLAWLWPSGIILVPLSPLWSPGPTCKPGCFFLGPSLLDAWQRLCIPADSVAVPLLPPLGGQAVPISPQYLQLLSHKVGWTT